MMEIYKKCFGFVSQKPKDLNNDYIYNHYKYNQNGIYKQKKRAKGNELS